MELRVQEVKRMKRYTREITKEQYDRAMKNNKYITEEDKKTIFTESEIWGYGVYSPKVAEKDGKYYVNYESGDSCD